ncbi:MAG: lysophospholipid acyltransferase family protein [Gammaproteobacteria bacterium]|nr:lysophospholipid acyltransferase family protein [Gammaproteobacteria bacterium]
MKLMERIQVVALKWVGGFSLKSIYRLSLVLYWVFKPFKLRFKRTIRINLSRCLPDLSSRALEVLAKKVELQTIWRMLEMPYFWFGKNQDSALKQCFGEAQFKRDQARGLGVIVLVPHLGTWEMVNCYVGSHYPSAALYKPFKKAYQEALLRQARERHGTEMYPATLSGIKGLFSALKRGLCIGVLPDHDPGENGGEIVPFFGIPANTTTLIAKLAAKSQVPLYFAFSERLPKGQGFQLHFVKAGAALSDLDLKTAATALNSEMSALIASYPEQYEWSYKRFRRTPWQGGKFY